MTASTIAFSSTFSDSAAQPIIERARRSAGSANRRRECRARLRRGTPFTSWLAPRVTCFCGLPDRLPYSGLGPIGLRPVIS
jgi:hypothetical protein